MKRSELKSKIEEIITELLNEDTIDVSNPNTLTPQQKQAAITKELSEIVGGAAAV